MDIPTQKEDLIPQFGVISEPGWDEAVRKILTDYEVPLPAPIQEEEIVKREQELGVRFNDELRLFLKTFGAVDIDGHPKLLNVEEIARSDNIDFSDCFSEDQLRQASGMIGIGKLFGTDRFGLELTTGNIYILEFHGCNIAYFLNSFSDLIKYGLINLSTGYYGFPGGEIEKLADEAIKATFGEDF